MEYADIRKIILLCIDVFWEVLFVGLTEIMLTGPLRHNLVNYVYNPTDQQHSLLPVSNLLYEYVYEVINQFFNITFK